MRGLNALAALLAIFAVGSMLAEQPAAAQAAPDDQSMRHFSDGEIAAVPMPELAFKESESDAQDYDKYFYFNRPETKFDEAYDDISECDALASGISYYAGAPEPYPGYFDNNGVGGVLGAVIGSAIGDAIRGSAQRRKIRRINMRNCMGYKGYQRYGLSKDLWQKFNFEEGNGRKRDEVREAALLQQARVASGPQPMQKALPL